MKKETPTWMKVIRLSSPEDILTFFSYFLTYLYLLPSKLPLLYCTCGNLRHVQLTAKDNKTHPSPVLPGYNVQMQIRASFQPPIYLNNVVLLRNMEENMERSLGSLESCDYTANEGSHAAADDMQADWIVSSSRSMRCSVTRD